MTTFISCQNSEEDELLIVQEEQEEVSNKGALFNYLVNELGFDTNSIEDKGDSFLVDGVVEFQKSEFDTTVSSDLDLSNRNSILTIYRSWRSPKHYYRQEPSRVGNERREGTIGKIPRNQVSGAAPLYYKIKYWPSYDKLLTTNRNEGSPAFIDHGRWGYIYTRPASGRSPVYRYYNTSTLDHFYTTNYNELRGGGSGYNYEQITGYTLR